MFDPNPHFMYLGKAMLSSWVTIKKEIENVSKPQFLFFSCWPNKWLTNIELSQLISRGMLKAPPLNPRDYISRTSKISPREGHEYVQKYV